MKGTPKKTGKVNTGSKPKAGPNMKSGSKPTTKSGFIAKTPDQRPFNPRGRGSRMP